MSNVSSTRDEGPMTPDPLRDKTGNSLMLPGPVPESELWRGARHILHIVGVNGAGKSTLGRMLEQRCVGHGGKTIFDSERRAYDAAFDRANAGRADNAIHRHVVDRALELIEEWKRSDVNLVIVDRWYESYDFQLPAESLEAIEAAIEGSGFQLHLIHLVVGESIVSDDFATMSMRMAHTKANRPESWWAGGQGTFDERVQEECEYQAAYREFCRRAPFRKITICTTAMDWTWYENSIVESLLFDRRWCGLGTEDAVTVLNTLLGVELP